MGLGDGRRGQFGKTSYDIGVMYTQHPPFNAGISKGAPLPPILQRRSQVSSSAGQLPVTTTRSEHSGKPQAGWQTQTRYPKAPPHWNTHYLNELAQRLRECPSVRLLSAPISEVRDSYRGLAAPKAPPIEHYDTLLTLHGQRDQVARSMEPLISTSHAHHRHFKRSELITPSGLDVPPAHLSLLKSSTHVHQPPQKAPPTDALTYLQRLPCPLATLLFAGKNSEYQDRFTMPPPHPAPTGPQASALPSWDSADAGVGSTRAGAEDGFGAVVGGGVGSTGARFGAIKHMLEVPKMYVTENDTYGCKKMILV